MVVRYLAAFARRSMHFVLVLVAAGSAGAQRFEDVTARSGIVFRHDAARTLEKHLIETMGSGVAAADLDGDGLPELLFVGGAGQDRLYRNLGGLRFEEATAGLGAAFPGYAMGVAASDADGDGDTDLAVTGLGRLTLYLNQGDLSFAARELEAKGWLAGAAFLDFDGDGRLDLFVSRYLDWDYERSRWCGEDEPGRRSYCHPREYGRGQLTCCSATWAKGASRTSRQMSDWTNTPARAWASR